MYGAFDKKCPVYEEVPSIPYIHVYCIYMYLDIIHKCTCIYSTCTLDEK